MDLLRVQGPPRGRPASSILAVVEQDATLHEQVQVEGAWAAADVGLTFAYAPEFWPKFPGIFMKDPTAVTSTLP